MPDLTNHETLVNFSEFIKNYHPYNWPLYYLRRATGALTWKDDDNNIVVAIWFSPVFTTRQIPGSLSNKPFNDGVLSIVEMHLCACPEYHSKWVTKSGIDAFYNLLFEIADVVLALETDPRRKKMLSRLGFDTSRNMVNILSFTEDIEDG